MSSKIKISKYIISLSVILLIAYLNTQPMYKPTAIALKNNSYILPTVIAHKATVSGNFAGNSLSAIKEVLTSNVDGIEMDVQMSKDGILYLYHPDTLEEETNHSGIVENMEWQQLAHIPYKNTNNEYFVLLDTVLKEIGKQKVIFLDVKSDDLFPYIMIKKITAVIRKYNLQQNIFVESFNPFMLLLFKLLASDIMIMYDFIDDTIVINEEYPQYANKVPWLLKQHWMHKQIMKIIRPDLLGPRFNLNHDELKNLIQHRYPIVVWTVNDKAIARSLYELGIKSIQTDKPMEIRLVIPKNFNGKM